MFQSNFSRRRRAGENAGLLEGWDYSDKDRKERIGIKMNADKFK
jgi:hypothetical protein